MAALASALRHLYCSAQLSVHMCTVVYQAAVLPAQTLADAVQVGAVSLESAEKKSCTLPSSTLTPSRTAATRLSGVSSAPCELIVGGPLPPHVMSCDARSCEHRPNNEHLHAVLCNFEV